MHPLPRFVRSSGAPKPRVLLVDDHRDILDRVSALLVDDFDVAGLATDGRQALDLARQVDPDVIVLDINMPGLDGLLSSHTPVCTDYAGRVRGGSRINRLATCRHSLVAVVVSVT
jgi:AmiR/NasT family two-component response regulator